MNNESQVLNLPIEDIIPNRFQPRLNFDETSLKELASSIKEHGIIQPLVVRKLNDKYEIIAGERRYKAAKMAGLTTVPALVSEMDDKKSAEVAIVENIQRRDLSSIEEAKSYNALLEKGYLTQEELAKKMGLSQSAISNKLRLLTLNEEVQNALMEGKISERHARSLLQLNSQDEQKEWLKKIIDERLTVRELDKKIKESIKEETINTEKEDKDDIPLIEVTPNIEEIKENAVDIFSTPEPKISPKEEPIIQTNSIPNKFFNFLEDESANMAIEEAKPMETIPIQNTNSLDDIEVLDFLAPEKKDMSIAEELIKNLETELKNNNYKASILTDENNEEIKYIITIEKE